MGEGHLKEGRNKVCPSYVFSYMSEGGHKCLERKARSSKSAFERANVSNSSISHNRGSPF